MAKLSQRKDERLAFVKLMRAEGVRSYLEIGLRLGHTFAYVGEHLPRGSTMVGVDLPGFSPWGVASDEVACGPIDDQGADANPWPLRAARVCHLGKFNGSRRRSRRCASTDL